jgi:arylsulfatase A-like enzyme
MQQSRRRKHLHLIVTVVVLIGLLCAEGALADEESIQPNILVLLADDAGWDDSTAYGNPRIRTPNIERLAESGMAFSRAFVMSPQCSPSRASMLTGLYPHQTGAEDLHEPIPADVTILPTYLEAEGYFTGSMLKRHVGRAASEQFDWYSYRLGRFAAFLEQADGRPFFLWVGFMDPHRPYLRGTIDVPHDPANVRVPAHLVDSPETRRDIARYYDEITRMDEWIGWFLDELERRGLRENTIIIYLSDNGAAFPRAKGSLYDTGVRIPYIWSWPAEIEPDSWHHRVASTIDLAPTLLDAAGAEVPASMEGRSILPVLRARGDAASRGGGREAVFTQRNWHGTEDHIRSVRTENFKLIINMYEDRPFGLPPDIAQSDSWKALRARKEAGRLSPLQRLNFALPRPPVEFYDLRIDPHEYNNRAWEDSYAEQQQRLFRLLDDWMSRTADFPPGPEPRGDATDPVTGRPREWRHRLLLWAERFVAPWLLPLVEREPNE